MRTLVNSADVNRRGVFTWGMGQSPATVIQILDNPVKVDRFARRRPDADPVVVVVEFTHGQEVFRCNLNGNRSGIGYNWLNRIGEEGRGI